MKEKYDALIIGAGAAGITAALYLARAGKKAAVFEKLFIGGQLAVLPKIENYPGAESAVGFEIAERMKNQAEKFGAEFVMKEVESVDLIEKTVYAGKEEYSGKTIVIATGAHSGKLGLCGEKELVGSGLSYCVTCDGAFFKGKDVALAGGGSRAKEELAYLSGIARTVYFITSGAKEESFSNVKYIGGEVTGFIGNPLKGVRIKEGEKEYELSVDGLFVDTGLVPETRLFSGLISFDDGGFIVTDEEMRTSLNGVFAVGDVRSKSLRQVVTATSDGAIAVAGVIKELQRQKN